MNNFELYKKTVLDMIKSNEGDLYIRSYINDLYRGKDITKSQWEELHIMYINTNFNGFDTIYK